MQAVEVKGVNLPCVRDLTARLDKPTVVIGPNGVGKSTLLGLAFLALEGPAGRLGGDGQVSVVFDDGSSVWRATSGGKHNLEVQTTEGSTSGVRSAQPVVDRLIGEAGRFRVRSFLDLSGAKRQKALDDILDMSWPRALDLLDTRAMERLTSAVAMRFPWSSQKDGQRAIRMLLEALEEASRVNERELTKARAAADTAKPIPDTVPPGTVGRWREEVERLTIKIAQQERALGKAEGSASARTALERRRDELVRQIADAGEARKRQVELERLVRDSRAWLESTQMVVDEKKAKQRTREAELAELEKRERELLDRRQEVAGELNTAKTEASVMAIPCWKVLFEAARAVEERFLEERGGMEGRDVALLTALRRAVVRCTFDELPPEVDQVAKLTTEIHGLRAQVDAAKRRCHQGTLDVEQVTSRLSRGAARAEVLRGELKGLTVPAAEELDAWSEELDKVRAELDDMVDGAAGSIRAVIESLEAERSQAEKNADILNDVAAARVATEKNRGALQSCMDFRGDVKAAIKDVREVARRLTRSSLQPLVEPAAELTTAVLGMPLNVRLTKAGAEVWFDAGGARRTLLEDASTSERIVGLMSLQAAMQSQVSGWRHVFVDDLEHLDGREGGRRTAFVRAMRDWQNEGRIDNFVGACVDDGWVPPDGVNWIRLEKR